MLYYAPCYSAEQLGVIFHVSNTFASFHYDCSFKIGNRWQYRIYSYELLTKLKVTGREWSWYLLISTLNIALDGKYAVSGNGL